VGGDRGSPQPEMASHLRFLVCGRWGWVGMGWIAQRIIAAWAAMQKAEFQPIPHSTSGRHYLSKSGLAWPATPLPALRPQWAGVVCGGLSGWVGFTCPPAQPPPACILFGCWFCLTCNVVQHHWWRRRQLSLATWQLERPFLSHVH